MRERGRERKGNRKKKVSVRQGMKITILPFFFLKITWERRIGKSEKKG